MLAPILAALMIACGAERPAHAPPPPVAAGDPDTPRLVVLVVVDQLPTRLLDRMRPYLSGGLASLTGDRAYTAVAAHTHAVTSTCPGHATLSTGAAPSVHGIVGNRWVTDGASIYCGDLQLLTADTLADRVAAAGGLVVSLAHKDRGAIMLGGRTPRAVITYDKAKGTFAGAPWAELDLTEARAKPWTPRSPEIYATFGRDDDPREEPVDGIVFPHDISGPETFLYSSPAADALVDAAIAGVDAESLGVDAAPDLLTLSFSNTDYIGHNYGTESWEAMDALLGVDQALGRLFSHLDGKVGPDRWTVLLSSDHGSAPIDARRLDGRPFVEAAGRGLDPAWGEVRVGSDFIDLPAGVPADRRADEARALAERVRSVDGIEGAWAWVDGIPDTVPFAGGIRRSFVEGRSGDVYVVWEEGVLAQPTGTSHGSPWAYDQQVPLLMLGAGVAPGHADGIVDTRRVAPTLAAILGVESPRQATEPKVQTALAGSKN